MKLGCETEEANAGTRRPKSELASGYLLTEALVYIGAVFVLLGAGSIALYRCIDNSLVLRRNADDLARVMHIGERWRADVRSAGNGVRLLNGDAGEVLHLGASAGSVEYRSGEGCVYRRIGSGPWVRVLERVKTSSMHLERRSGVSAWYWDLELEPQIKGSVKAGRVRPILTFIAASPAAKEP
jgi:hypothetical protein